MPPLASLQLRRLLLRSFRSPSLSFIAFSPIKSPPLFPQQPSSNLLSHFQSPTLLAPPSLFTTRYFSSEPFVPTQPHPEDPDPISRALSSELLKDPDSDPLSVSQRLHLSFSHITPTPNLVLETLNLSPEAGRTVLGFHQWLALNPNFTHTDDTLSYFVDYFGRRKDFKATHEVLSGGGAGPKTLSSAIDRLVRAGRPSQAVQFFEKMDRDYGLKRDRASLKLVVENLCSKGFASHAEKMVKDLAKEFFPDEATCDLLIIGWCVNGKLDEARRLAGEIYRGGFELGVDAYNAMLDCVWYLSSSKTRPSSLFIPCERRFLVQLHCTTVPPRRNYMPRHRNHSPLASRSQSQGIFRETRFSSPENTIKSLSSMCERSRTESLFKAEISGGITPDNAL